MKRFVSFSLAFLSLTCLLLATEREAHGFTGYVDPGSGLLALQCLTSVGAAVGYFMRRRIAALFGSRKETTELAAPSTSEDSSLEDA